MKEKESLGLTECESTLVIKYNRPALDLSDGLTVGNGRLSANICGTERGIERIMLCGGRLYTAVCAEHGITDPTDALGLYLRAHALLGQSGAAAAEHGKAADGNKKAGSAVENAPAENTFTMINLHTNPHFRAIYREKAMGNPHRRFSICHQSNLFSLRNKLHV